MITEETEIDFAQHSDAAEISQLSRTEVEYGLGWHYTGPRITQLIHNNSKNVVVARIEKRLVGFGIMTYHKETANLDLLAVKKAYRRMKVATQLVKWLEKVALAAGIFNVFV